MNPLTAYVATSLIWAVVGLTVGYFLGRGVARSHNLPEGAATMTIPAPSTPNGRRRLAREQLLGYLIVVLAIASVVAMSITLGNQQRAIDAQTAAVACQAEYNARFIAALTERNDAAANERMSQRALLTVVINPNAGQDVIAGALQRYLDGLANADAQRNANPLPLQPTCG